MPNHPEHPDWEISDQNNPQQNSFDFLGMVYRRFWMIFLCLVFATGGGVFWYWKSPVKYSSVARTHIYFQKPEISIIGNEGFSTTSPIQSHHELFKSESVLYKTAEEILKIIREGTAANSQATSTANKQPQQKTELPALVNAEKETDNIANSNTDRVFAELHGQSRKQILSHLLRSIEVTMDRNDQNIFQVSYSGANQKDCHVILGIVINKYEQHLTNKYENEGKEILDKIQQAQRRIATELGQSQNALDQWRTEVRAVELEKFQQGFSISDLGQKTNRYRVEAQQLYVDIAKLEKQKETFSNDEKWIKEAIDSKMSKQAILTHINKFSEWLQIEQRKSNTVSDLKSENPVILQFEEPEPTPELIEARFKIEGKKGAIEELKDKGFGENYPGLRSLTRELKQLESQLKFLENFHTKRIEKAKTKFEEMKKQATQLVATDRSELPKILSEIDLIGLHKAYLEQKLIRLDVDLAELKTQHANKLAQAKIVDQLLQEEQDLEKEISMQESLNNTVLQKIREIDLEKNNGGYILDILNSPSYAKQTEPSILKTFAITTFLGLVIGIAFAYLVEIADKTFRSPAEIAQQLGMRVIGHVPVLSTKKVDNKNSKLDESLIAAHLPKSQQSEAFRAIRTALFFNAQGKTNQIIQITSPTPGDGKSTLAANLSISLAQSGKRVLIIDADLRRPTVDYLFGVDSKNGFAAVLSGNAEINDAILDSEVDGLSVMPAGSRPSNPAELLTSSNLYDLCETLREKFDFIIVDSPPMLAVTDPTAVAARADGVLLALRIKKNVKLSASRTKEVLDSVNANILGIVVNGAAMVQGNYSNAAAYGYGYGGYGYGSNYYSYGYDYGESSYYYDEETRPTAAKQS
ncbi:MAG: polysaccharide biosynthesis tyrosine autokinase [Planctomycetota bacterium]|nr:polysaccharide biosynthesis tyrosine autokinase [Planctomycetota bacterium]